MNCLCKLAKWPTKAPNAMDRETVDQPVGYVSIFDQSSQHRQLMTAGERLFGAFEATTAHPVEDET